MVDHPKFKLKFENTHIVRNEGAKMSKGQKLWKRAKDIIPGGNMLLSKRPEMFLPDLWPSYFFRHLVVMCGTSMITNLVMFQ